jgi:DNA processing protein
VLDERAGGRLKAAEVSLARERARRENERAEREAIGILVEDDAEYPALLRETADPPLVLYVRGNPAFEPGVAIVGARKADAYGITIAQTFARALSAIGLPVVSGLAYGVDAAAHRATLDENSRDPGAGRTLAILGSGLLRLYPSDHADLARRIVESGGAIVSEFPLSAPPRRWNFPRRNRVIAGMTHGTVIIQAGAKSGSLITARLASEYGRQVWVVPNRVGDPLAEGGHALLRIGATMAASPTDVIEDLTPVLGKKLRRARAAPGLEAVPPTTRMSALGGAAGMRGVANSAPSAEISVLAAIGAGGATRDEILERAALPPPELPRLLLKLELSGHVAAMPGGLFRLTRLGAAGSS